jgi:hypothetical protein
MLEWLISICVEPLGANDDFVPARRYGAGSIYFRLIMVCFCARATQEGTTLTLKETPAVVAYVVWRKAKHFHNVFSW